MSFPVAVLLTFTLLGYISMFGYIWLIDKNNPLKLSH